MQIVDANILEIIQEQIIDVNILQIIHVQM
jgi:hypothetical protein